tara:strand:- start:512 stop:679 length:168 start_codon:yes stop_codon:yes gene_type:complete
MVESLEGRPFALEASSEVFVEGEVGVDHLDRDVGAPRLAAEVDGAHAPAPKFALD